MSFLGLPDQVYHVGLIFLRVGALVMLMPAIGEAVVPPRIRLGLAMMLALCLGPIATPTLPPMPVTVGEMGGQLFKELFIGLALGAMLRVMQAALDIAAGDLDVPVRRRADPDVRPGRRNDQSLDPIQRGRVLHSRAVGVGIDKSGLARLAPNARIKTVYVDKTRGTVGHTNLAIRRARLKGRAAA